MDKPRTKVKWPETLPMDHLSCLPAILAELKEVKAVLKEIREWQEAAVRCLAAQFAVGTFGRRDLMKYIFPSSYLGPSSFPHPPQSSPSAASRFFWRRRQKRQGAGTRADRPSTNIIPGVDGDGQREA